MRVFIYWAPHRLHGEWADLVCDKKFPIIPHWMPHWCKMNKIVTQASAVIRSLFLPKADTYFIEGFMCIIPAYLRKRGAKIIMINSDTLFYDAPKMKGFRKKLFEKMLPYVDGMISTSEYVSKSAKQYTTVPDEIAFPYVNDRFFEYNSESKNNLVQIGGLRKSKGSDLLLEIQKETKISLTVIGPIDEKEFEYAKTQEGVKVTGWTDKVGEHIEEGGVYINLARHESFGVAVLEGMAAGLVPLVSENCGVKEAVEQVDPRLVIPLEKKMIKERLDWLIKTDKKELSAKAKEAASKYTQKESMKQFLRAFTKLEEKINE